MAALKASGKLEVAVIPIFSASWGDMPSDTTMTFTRLRVRSKAMNVEGSHLVGHLASLHLHPHILS